MNKTLLKNHWILAGLLLIITLILGLTIVALIRYFKVPTPASIIAGVIGTMIVGYIYTVNFKEVMPKKLRIKVVAIYILVQMLFGILLFWVRGGLNVVIIISLLVGLSIFFPFIYWILGSGGRIYLKYVEGVQKRAARPK